VGSTVSRPIAVDHTMVSDASEAELISALLAIGMTATAEPQLAPFTFTPVNAATHAPAAASTAASPSTASFSPFGFAPSIPHQQPIHSLFALTPAMQRRSRQQQPPHPHLQAASNRSPVRINVERGTLVDEQRTRGSTHGRMERARARDRGIFCALETASLSSIARAMLTAPHLASLVFIIQIQIMELCIGFSIQFGPVNH
jgi:hypothetical protein